MIIGFTGTRSGMTTFQRKRLTSFLEHSKGEFHHGDCIGSDAQAHDIAEKTMECVIHPPLKNVARAFKKAKVIHEPKDYLKRNLAIVEICELLIATPGSSTEESRGSGTWATIRYARRAKKRTIIIHPDGKFTDTG